MSVQANWHVGDLDLPEVDPLRQIQELKSAATMIDLTRSPAEIHADLRRLTAKEGRFDSQCDLRCDIKWEPTHKLMGGDAKSCYTCPHFTDSRDEGRTALCTLGRRQEDLIGVLTSVRASEALDAAYVAAVERDVNACEELAEAHAALA